MPKPKIEINAAQVEALAARGLTEQQICDSLGISRTTLHARRRESAQIEQAITKGRAQGIAIATNKLFELIKNGHPPSIYFFLKCKGGWKETQVQEITGKDGGPIQTQHADLSGLSDEELNQLDTLTGKLEGAAGADSGGEK
jgi:predicted DNA-binding protein (UPF0251 family)